MIYRVIFAEIAKQRKNYYETWNAKISTYCWPILICFSTYYTYMAFDITVLSRFGINTTDDLMIFLVTGLLAYNWFWCLVQNARLLLMERANGTVEEMFLSPANRMALVYGRSLGGIFSVVGLYIMFMIIVIFHLNESFNMVLVLKVIMGLLILIMSGTVWGGFINSVYLISRDVGFWFTLCDAPMNILSGTSMPVAGFPVGLFYLSCVFPLTFCLNILRGIFLFDEIGIKEIIPFVINLIIFIILTKGILDFAEKHNRKTGKFQLY